MAELTTQEQLNKLAQIHTMNLVCALKHSDLLTNDMLGEIVDVTTEKVYVIINSTDSHIGGLQYQLERCYLLEHALLLKYPYLSKFERWVNLFTFHEYLDLPRTIYFLGLLNYDWLRKKQYHYDLKQSLVPKKSSNR